MAITSQDGNDEITVVKVYLVSWKDYALDGDIPDGFAQDVLKSVRKATKRIICPIEALLL